jgi:hypothetical protein
MEALQFGKGNDHPHRPSTLTVHTYIREITERSPLEVVHIPATVHFNIKYKKGSTNNVAYFVS